MKRTKRVTKKRRVRTIRAVESGEQKGSMPEWEWAKIPHKQPKKRITLYMDADILFFFKGYGRLYQRMVNQALRSVMDEEKRRAR